MQLLGIHGSPRKNGNTEILLDTALKAAEDAGAKIVKVRLAEMDFKSCQACGGCNKKGVCSVQDDMQDLFPKLIEFDRFIIASPIFFKSVSGLTKSMIDRGQCFWVAKYRLDNVPWKDLPPRIGAFIATCGANRRDMFDPALSTVKSFYMTLDIKYQYELLVEGMDHKGAVIEHPDILDKARKLGEEIAK
jgi:multimeric flavodoxin WrbA